MLILLLNCLKYVFNGEDDEKNYNNNCISINMFVHEFCLCNSFFLYL